ncbi:MULTISPECIES: TetR/AcrR family transcriptional regulator [Lysobacteraceae]|uniref:TetR/AcrR family transcriptional regulator n=1 Tax=Novilysobacter avium TaxID=2781023 RepID=A0A7S6UIN7_9GAMM|nr:MULTISPECIES: TetR/AcrR family transcriptional regulator [Lysobacter]QOW21038.1 TetR/AcrR family transcriptional regulator [Lysobacter avium]QOW23533.1 TetR/AcrR family transcriptional regulator [Lysobacter sp. H23M47]
MNAAPDIPAANKAEARVEAQRERILVAAQKCFVERGFHGASMANIADTAGMSAGLIYRYFAGKNEIILAIVEHQLAMLLKDMNLKRKVDITAELIASFDRGGDDETRGMNPALLLEMSAEATRDPSIAASLDGFDRALRCALASWLAEDDEDGRPGLPKPLAQQRALLMQLLFEGLKVRQTREPDLDRDLLEAALREFVPQLLEA